MVKRFVSKIQVTVHCPKSRNWEENVQSFWSFPTTSYYPLLLSFSSGFCAFWNQGRNRDSMIAFGRGNSFHLAHELQCLSMLHFLGSLDILCFGNICFHNHGLCHFLHLNYPHSMASWVQIQISYWLAFSTLPKHQESTEFWTVFAVHSEEFRTQGEFAHRHQQTHL